MVISVFGSVLFSSLRYSCRCRQYMCTCHLQRLSGIFSVLYISTRFSFCNRGFQS